MIKTSNKKILAVALVVIIAFSFAVAAFTLFQCRKINENTNKKIEAIVETVIKENPGISEPEIMTILNQDTPDYNILKKYGIDISKDAAVLENEKREKQTIAGVALLTMLTGVLILALLLLNERKKNCRIREITGYLEKINNGDYELDVYDNSEDLFSILKNEIYKTAVTLREKKENSEIERLAVKKSVSDISHQLKTPLTSISIMTEILESDSTMEPEKKQEFITDIRTELSKVNFLVQQLLKLAKFDTNTVVFNREKANLVDIAKAAKADLKNLSEKNGVKIEIHAEDDAIILCDKKWQKEAVANILKNSLEYSEQGTCVTVNILSNRIYKELVITDEAGGMNETDRKHIFERFYKGENASEESCGIGMNLARNIIEKDGGDIIVETEEGKGSTFRIRYFHEIS